MLLQDDAVCVRIFLFFSLGQFKQQVPVRGVRAATEAARTDQLLAYGSHLRWHGDGVTTTTVVSDVPARHGAEDERLADCGSDLLEGTVSQSLPHHRCPHYINTQHTPSIHFTWLHIPPPVFTLHSFTPHDQCPLYIATHPPPASTLHSRTPHHQCLQTPPHCQHPLYIATPPPLASTLHSHTPHHQSLFYIATLPTASVHFTSPRTHHQRPLYVASLPTTSVHFT